MVALLLERCEPPPPIRSVSHNMYVYSQDSGCGKRVAPEIWSIEFPLGGTRFSNYIWDHLSFVGRFFAVKAIDTRDPIKSGLTRARLA